MGAADARDHLREGIRAASRMKGQELAVYRVLHAMDRLDPESAGGAVRHMETDRRAGMQSLAEHLEREGELREGLTVEEAVDALWVLTSFESLDLLVTGRGLTVDAAIETLVDMAERAVCRTAERPGRTWPGRLRSSRVWSAEHQQTERQRVGNAVAVRGVGLDRDLRAEGLLQGRGEPRRGGAGHRLGAVVRDRGTRKQPRLGPSRVTT